MPERIAIVTCLDIPEPDHDEPLLMSALAEAGFEADLVAWEDQSVDWESYPVAVVRSTWNYLDCVEAFKDWIRSTGEKTRLLNPPEAMVGNLHKGYLLDLAALGVPVVPTTLVRQGGEVLELPYEGGVVVKPAIGAGSWHAKIFGADERDLAQEFLSESCAERDTLVQPVVESVFGEGERSLVWIGGDFTHKVVKRPRFSDDSESVSEGLALDEEDLEIGRAVMAHAPEGLLYARVDVMRREGRLELSELEITEPSLFFFKFGAALDVFVSSVRALF